MTIDWELALAFVVAAASGVWAVLRWVQEREKDRKEGKRRLEALYVTPLLVAAEELQSRLYNILCHGGLAPLRKRYQGGTHADETLYLVAQYFAYESFFFRYSPFSTDPTVVDVLLVIREAFSTDRPGLDPWCLFKTQQRTLGALARDMREGEFGSEADVVPFPTFRKRLDDQPEEDRPQQAIQQLASAEEASDLGDVTQVRLADVQSGLVDLIENLGLKVEARVGWYPEGRQRALDNPAIQRSLENLHKLRPGEAPYQPMSIHLKTLRQP
jgi:hypothetical protein